MADISRRRSVTRSLMSLAEPIAMRAAYSLASADGRAAFAVAVEPTGADLVGPEVWERLLRHAATVVANPMTRIELVEVHDVVDYDAYSVERLADHVLARMRVGADVVDAPTLETRRVVVRRIVEARDDSQWYARSSS